jgi:hypothetical protein
VLPGISSVSPNSGSPAGQQLTITGTGFSTNTSVIDVSVGGTNCDVVSASLSQIVCNLNPQNTSATAQLPTNDGSQTDGFFSGAGLNYARYNISGLSQNNIAGLRSAIQTNSPQLILQESGYRGDIKTGNYSGTYYG